MRFTYFSSFDFLVTRRTSAFHLCVVLPKQGVGGHWLNWPWFCRATVGHLGQGETMTLPSNYFTSSPLTSSPTLAKSGGRAPLPTQVFHLLTPRVSPCVFIHNFNCVFISSVAAALTLRCAPPLTLISSPNSNSQLGAGEQLSIP